MASVLPPDASAAALRSGTPSPSTSATPSPIDAFEAIHDPTFSLDCWRSRMTPWSASAAPVAPGAGAEGAAADVGAGAAGSEGAASGTEGSIAASDDDAPDAPPAEGSRAARAAAFAPSAAGSAAAALAPALVTRIRGSAMALSGDDSDSLLRRESERRGPCPSLPSSGDARELLPDSSDPILPGTVRDRGTCGASGESRPAAASCSAKTELVLELCDPTLSRAPSPSEVMLSLARRSAAAAALMTGLPGLLEVSAPML